MDLVKENIVPTKFEDDMDFYEREIYSFRLDIFRFINAAVMDKNLAEDLTQDLMETAWRKRSQLRKYENVRGALIVMAKHKLVEYRRRSKDVPVVVSLDDQEYQMGREEEMALRDLLDKESHFELMVCIGKLREDYKRLIVLHYYYDLPLKAVAAVTGIPYNTVLSWHGRALRKLGELLLESKKKDKEDRHGSR